MIVGFVIESFLGHEDEAVAFIQKVCILSDRSIAQNIVAAGPGVNIFSKGVTLADLRQQPFRCSPIMVEDGEVLIVSAVDFIVEIESPNGLVRLLPSQYLRVSANEAIPFFVYERQGLVKILPEIDDIAKEWILRNGIWDDSANWKDSSNWKDTDE